MQKNNPGIGWAYREGMLAATGNYVALMAGDLETEPAAVDRMVEKIAETGCDEVIANRWLPGGGFTNYDPLKYVLNWIFQKMFRVLFLTRIGDFTFGFKILSKRGHPGHRLGGHAPRSLYRNYFETSQEAGIIWNKFLPFGWAEKKAVASTRSCENFRYVKMGLKTFLTPVRQRTQPRESA